MSDTEFRVATTCSQVGLTLDIFTKHRDVDPLILVGFEKGLDQWEQFTRHPVPAVVRKFEREESLHRDIQLR